MAKRLGNVAQKVITPQAHHNWALKLWRRMDRDHSDHMTHDELNCEEFQDVLRSVIAPGTVGKSVATYGRASQNIRQAINFCLRKADCNSDGTLSFEEFEAFTRVLRNEREASHSANLIFALFDLDGDSMIDEEEFREIYRFFLGHHPTAAEFSADWEALDDLGAGRVTREQYVRWLQTSGNPIFKQHAPPVQGTRSLTASQELGVVRPAARRSPKRQQPAPGLLPRVQSSPCSVSVSPEWNDRFNAKKVVELNLEQAKGMPRKKTFFSRPQSEGELKRFYASHNGFEDRERRMRLPGTPRRHPAPVLSTDSWESLRSPGAGRHFPGGTMTNDRGEVTPWRELTPRALKKVPWDKGADSLRCPARPLPAFLFLGRDAPD